MDDLLAFDSDLGARFDHPAGGPGDLVLSVEWGEVGGCGPRRTLGSNQNFIFFAGCQTSPEAPVQCAPGVARAASLAVATSS